MTAPKTPEGLKANSRDILTIGKTWGYERTFYNAEYCLKELGFVGPGKETSMHFHLDKHETLYVVSGRLDIEYIVDKLTHRRRLSSGMTFVVPRGLPHKLIVIDTPTIVIEGSTFDFPDDSIRIG